MERGKRKSEGYIYIYMVKKYTYMIVFRKLLIIK